MTAVIPPSHYARAAISRVAGRVLSGGVVLLYHRVFEPERDPQLLAVRPRHFEEHMALVRERFRPMALGELVEGARRRRVPERAVAVTFDDGYADNLHQAKPVLERSDVPATVFVATGYTGTGREFWWDELDRLLHGSEAYEASLAEFKLLPPAAVEERLERMRAEIGEPTGGAHRAENRAMTVEELSEISGDGLVELGAHTRRHPSLASQAAETERRELRQSKDDLERWLDQPVEAVSYPFGGRPDWSRRTRHAARAAGFAYAAANVPGLVNRWAGRFALPRHLIRDWPGDEFESRLESMFRTGR